MPVGQLTEVLVY